MFYSRSDPEPAFLICVYRYKYKSHNHINTRYCWRQSHFCYILYLDHSKIYDIYSSKTHFVFYKMSQRFFLYRTTITKQINTAKFPNIENISSHNGWLKYPLLFQWIPTLLHNTSAFNNSKLFLPYIIRFITLILFTLPSASRYYTHIWFRFLQQLSPFLHRL